MHYTIGGIVANRFGQTNVKGMYAIGGAVTGFHGAIVWHQIHWKRVLWEEIVQD